MFELGCVLSLLGVLSLISYYKINNNSPYKEGVLIMVLMFLLLGTNCISVYINTEVISIQCLKGNNPYKEQIIYEWRDSIQVPVDTIYSLKK